MKRLTAAVAVTIALCLILEDARAQEVLLQWDPNPPEEEVTEYRLYRRLATDDFNLDLPLASTPETTYRDRQVDYWKRYGYVVSAVNSIGESEPSNEILIRLLTVPSRPGGFSAEQQGANVTLRWLPNPADEAVVSYAVERRLGGLWEEIASTGQTFFRDRIPPGRIAPGRTTPLDPAYRVSAENAAGRSEPSERVSIRTPVQVR